MCECVKRLTCFHELCYAITSIIVDLAQKVAIHTAFDQSQVDRIESEIQVTSS